jgi:two-component system, response regulator PdtaR
LTVADSAHRDLSGWRVLVVEDEPLIALDLRDTLEGWGCRVIGPVATASAALELVKESLPDCAVLDVNLGRETSEPVAAALRSRHCPFIVMTAYQRHDLSGALVDALLLSKPLDEKRLREELSRLMTGGGLD